MQVHQDPHGYRELRKETTRILHTGYLVKEEHWEARSQLLRRVRRLHTSNLVWDVMKHLEETDIHRTCQDVSYQKLSCKYVYGAESSAEIVNRQ